VGGSGSRKRGTREGRGWWIKKHETERRGRGGAEGKGRGRWGMGGVMGGVEGEGGRGGKGRGSWRWGG